jgi:hypothetical protein
LIGIEEILHMGPWPWVEAVFSKLKRYEWKTGFPPFATYFRKQKPVERKQKRG